MAVFIALAFTSTAFAQGLVNLPQTGQTTSYATGDDGDTRAGIRWPIPRFTVGTGAEADCVTDNLTGLMWAKNANLPDGTITWQGAINYVASINSGNGLCGYKDWRLPNRKELRSLIDYSRFNPALPSGHPFTSVQSTGHIKRLMERGVTYGCNSPAPNQVGTMFCPNLEMTRWQMAVMIIRALYGEDFNYPTTPYFSDVDVTDAGFKYIKKLKEVGITKAEGMFYPNRNLSREEMSAFLGRAFLGME